MTLESATTTEAVVLLDDDGTAIGHAPKASIHGRNTPLHLAFSCYVFDDSGRLLVTRRSLEKATWPGVWSNSFCGHPRPGESMTAALIRYASHELRCDVENIELRDGEFRYRAEDPTGMVENEICPVYRATLASDIQPNPREVSDYAWADPHAVEQAVRAVPWAFSPWMVRQIARRAHEPGVAR